MNLNQVEPSCPTCGSSMVVRTAQTGPYSGKKFYGCSRFPTCRGIVNIGQDGDTSIQGANSADTSLVNSRVLSSGPRPLVAAPTHPGDNTKFFQNASAPASLVQSVQEHEIDFNLVRSLSQWRLDYPNSGSIGINGYESHEQTTLNVLESILLRGTFTLCSPSMEKFLLTKYGSESPSEASLLQSLITVLSTPSSIPVASVLDSHEEEMFFDEANDFIHQTKSGWYILPQISFSSMNPNVTQNANQRSDFFFHNAIDGASFVLEIDGAQHQDHQQADTQRDHLLMSVGIKTIRVSAADIRNAGGTAHSSVSEYIPTTSIEKYEESDLSAVLRIGKFVNQLQVSVLEAYKSGFLKPSKKNIIAVETPGGFSDIPWTDIVNGISEDLLELIENISGLYSFSADWARFEFYPIANVPNPDLVICPSRNKSNNQSKFPSVPIFAYSDISFGADIVAPSTSLTPVTIPNPSYVHAEWFLNYIFRKPSFWEGQWETIERGLQGKDSVVLLPTGGGKSIAFQLTALLLPGRAIVVAPLVSLIDDQTENLSAMGLDRVAGVTGQKDRVENQAILDAFKFGHYLILYVTPERFQIVEFREALRALTVSYPVNIIAIDEAHCVSEWGHDFRTSYLNLGRISREYCLSGGHTPPLIALTGTASKTVLKDVQRELSIVDFEAIITPQTFNREELQFSIFECKSEEKNNRMAGFIRSLPSKFNVSESNFFLANKSESMCGIVFCPHVNGDYGVDRVAEELRNDIPMASIQIYSGTAPRYARNENWNEVRRNSARSFKNNQTTLLVATKAFGMGIDKPNVRYTVHIGLPESIESFYQEAGRAGRDKNPAESVIIVSNDDARRSERLLNPSTTIENLVDSIDETGRTEADDITRALFFHSRTFHGQSDELADLKTVLTDLGNTQERATVTIVPSSQLVPRANERRDAPRTRTEKALHRLVVIGVVEDYTLNYSSSEFTVTFSGYSQDDIAGIFAEYVSSYQGRRGEVALEQAHMQRCPEHNEYVLRISRLLINFVYEHIELSRRRSLQEMLTAATASENGEEFRTRILEYLQQSEFDEGLETIIKSSTGGLEEIPEILDGIVSQNDASSLRGSVARLLGDYPDVPGLLILRAASEALSRNGDPGQMKINLESALSFSQEDYQVNDRSILIGIKAFLAAIKDNPDMLPPAIRVISRYQSENRNLLIQLLRIAPVDAAIYPAIGLTKALVKRSRDMRIKVGGSM